MKRYEKGYSSVPMQILALPVICLLIGIVLISIGIWDLASDQTKGYEKNHRSFGGLHAV